MSSPQRQLAEEPDAGAHDAIGFVLRLGRALHSYGFPANRLEDAMGKASEKLGIEGQFFSTPTSIFASFGPQDDQRTFLIRVTPGEVNLGKLTALDTITARVLRGTITPAEGSAKIDWTLSAPPTYGRALTTLAFGMASAGAPRIARATPLPMWTEVVAQIVMSLAFTVLLKARPRDTVWIVISGALAIWGTRLGVNFLGPELGVFLGALIVGVASSWYARLCDRPAMVTQIPGILLLVPGSIGFRGLAALLDKQVLSGVDTTFKMIITAVALVAGTLIANIVAPSRREI